MFLLLSARTVRKILKLEIFLYCHLSLLTVMVLSDILNCHCYKTVEFFDRAVLQKGILKIVKLALVSPRQTKGERTSSKYSSPNELNISFSK